MAFDLSALIRLYLRPIKLLIFLRLEFSPIEVYWSFVDNQVILNREAGIIFVPGVQARLAGCKVLVVGF
jgi:hypothetical protein